MSQSSHGGNGNASSTNPQGHRPGKTKHSESSDVAKGSEDVFLEPQTPRTPTRKRTGILALADKFSRSPPDNEPPNRKCRADDKDASQNKTTTVTQPPSRPQRADSDMETHSSSSTTRESPTNQSPRGSIIIVTDEPNDAPKHKVTQLDLANALKDCIQMAVNLTSNVDGVLVLNPSKQVTEQLKLLNSHLDASISNPYEMDDDAFEGAEEQMYAPGAYVPAPAPPDSQRIARLETAVNDIAIKFDTLTLAIVNGQRTNASATPPNQTADPTPWSQPPANAPPNTSTATGPTYKPTAKPREIHSFSARHHNSRLIINITPTPSREQQAAYSGPRIRDAINERLHTAPETNHMRIGLVSWSNMGNAVINTANGLTATELEPHALKFTDLLPHTPEATFVVQPDTPWYKVSLHGVPTRGGSYIHINSMETDQPVVPDPKMLLDELLTYNTWLKDRKIIGEPRWMAAPETLQTKDKASVVIAFSNKADADELLNRRGVFMFGHRASTKAYIDIPPLRHCTNCWMLEHTTAACKMKPRCRLCADEHHTDQHNCELCDSLGSSCEHTVVKCVHCPDSNSPHFADSYTCPYRRAYKGTALAAPRTNGGRWKKKPKTGNQPTSNAAPLTRPVAVPQPGPMLTPMLCEGIRMTAKLGAPYATDEQLQTALDETGYNLTAAPNVLREARTRTQPDDIQPPFPSL